MGARHAGPPGGRYHGYESCYRLGRGSGIRAAPRWFPFLAELVARSRGPEEGLKILAGGLALLGNTEERLCEAELHRVNGELLLIQRPSNIAQAENCFQHAIEVARTQSAKSLELRARKRSARHPADRLRSPTSQTATDRKALAA